MVFNNFTSLFFYIFIPFILSSSSSSSSSSFLCIVLFSNLIHNLGPIKSELIVPAIRPINTDILNVYISLSPTHIRVTTAIIVVILVHIFLLNVFDELTFTKLFISSSVSYFLLLYNFFLFSLILSNTTIVSFIE